MRRKTARLLVVGASVIYMATQMNVAAQVYGRNKPTAMTAISQGIDFKMPQIPAVTASAITEESTVDETEKIVWSLDIGAEDAEILKRIAMAEAEGEDTEGKALVMLVVLNRVWSDDFPDSVEDVVFQKLGGVNQFSPVADGGRYWTREPNEDCSEALELVMSGWDESQGALFFEACAGTSWHSENLEFLFEHGGHRFYR